MLALSASQAFRGLFSQHFRDQQGRCLDILLRCLSTCGELLHCQPQQEVDHVKASLVPEPSETSSVGAQLQQAAFSEDAPFRKRRPASDVEGRDTVGSRQDCGKWSKLNSGTTFNSPGATAQQMLNLSQSEAEKGRRPSDDPDKVGAPRGDNFSVTVLPAGFKRRRCTL